MVPDEPLPEQHVLVELDDGDSRLVDVEKIRMLPSDYSRVGEFIQIMNNEFDSINHYQYSRTLYSTKHLSWDLLSLLNSKIKVLYSSKIILLS